MVSIIIPYKEDRGYLDEALDSINQQTYKDFEIILSQSEASVGINLNKGIKKAKGEFVCYLCDDDLLTPNSLKDRVEAFNDDIDFIHSRGFMLWTDGNITEYRLTNPYAQFNSVLENNGIMGGSTMYRRELFDTYQFNEELWTAEEWDFHLQLLSNNKKLHFVDTFSYIYRRHYRQKSIGNISSDYQAKRDKVKEEIKSWYTQQQ